MDLIALLALLGVAGVLLFFALTPTAGAIASRLRRFASAEVPSAAGRPGAWLRALGARVDGALGDRGAARRLDRVLGRAGLPWTPGEFILGLALAGAAAGFGAVLATGTALAGIAAAALPWLLAAPALGHAARLRTAALVEQLPEALLLLASALRAGNGLLQALKLLERQLPDPLAGEIRATLREVGLGLPFDTALRNLQDRVGTPEVEMIVVACLVQRQTGGNLAEILLNVHEMVADRIRLRGDLLALTAQGRASAAILSVLPPAIAGVIFFLNPGYIRVLWTDPRGQALLAGGVALAAAGTLAIRRIVDVRY